MRESIRAPQIEQTKIEDIKLFTHDWIMSKSPVKYTVIYRSDTILIQYQDGLPVGVL